MTEYELIEWRNQATAVARAWRKELKADGWTPKAIRENWHSTKRFVGSLYQLAPKYGCEITEEIE